MDVTFQALSPSGLATTNADAVLLVLQSTGLPRGFDRHVAKLVNTAVRQGDLAFKSATKLYLHRPEGMRATRLAVVVADDDSPKAIKLAVVSGLALLPAGVKHAAVALATHQATTPAQAEAVALAVSEQTYVYRTTKPSAPAANALNKVTLLGAKEQAEVLAQGLSRGNALADGIRAARELGNRPGNHCTPTFLGEEAQRIGKHYGFKVEVLGRTEIEKLGMGSFLAVAQGSTEPPRFIVMHYHGAANKNAAPHVLVGKGITFDSGGISLKPGPEMDEMKFDMGGAASVLGTMTAIGEIKPALNIVALIATCENMPAGNALKPGDVVRSMSGQTIEVLNTDAEGRLILCDALTYAERFKPASVVDIATLTGSCVMALGHHRSGLFSPDDALAEALLAAGLKAMDPAWRMPLDAEYEEGLKSNFADVANIAGRPAGSVTAAMFLKRFAGAYRWAHLDIAGTAWKSGAAKGATGRPVGLLTHYLLAQAGAEGHATA
jgi:leucyl aminopeptidase